MEIVNLGTGPSPYYKFKSNLQTDANKNISHMKFWSLNLKIRSRKIALWIHLLLHYMVETWRLPDLTYLETNRKNKVKRPEKEWWRPPCAACAPNFPTTPPPLVLWLPWPPRRSETLRIWQNGTRKLHANIYLPSNEGHKFALISHADSHYIYYASATQFRIFYKHPSQGRTHKSKYIIHRLLGKNYHKPQ